MKKSILAIMLLAITTIAASAQIADKAENISPLLIGEIIPNEKVIGADLQSIDLYSVIEKKPTVLVFYRGGWCPYCNRQLAALGEAEKEILDLGFQIVAISPDDVQNLFSTKDENKISYQLFSDPKGNLIQKTGIAFSTPDKSKEHIAKKTKGTVTEMLPVPTVMVVNTKGEIMFEYINPNYKLRMTSDLLLAVLKQLKLEM